VNWRLKAAVQRACAALPVGGEAAYYSLQRTFGLLRDSDRPLMMLRAAADLVRELRELGFDLHGKRVLELGTGWRVDLPIGLFLCGAGSVATFDRHRYLKPRLVMAALASLARQRPLVVETFAGLTEQPELERRLDALIRAADLDEVFRVAGIEYRAPADATRTGQRAGSVDLHMSFSVLQHIPYETLLNVLRESSRVLSRGGVAWHHIDLSDQFAHADNSISRINFLRYSDAEWSVFSGNQFAYHNRLRASDYERLYREAGHEIIRRVTEVDERSRVELESGFPVAEQFRGLPTEMLAIDTVRVISRPAR
jgi:SAM-dependent methyltransferase